MIIVNVFGLVQSYNIVAYAGGRSYGVHLENGVRETLGSLVCVKFRWSSGASGIRRQAYNDKL